MTLDAWCALLLGGLGLACVGVAALGRQTLDLGDGDRNVCVLVGLLALALALDLLLP